MTLAQLSEMLCIVPNVFSGVEGNVLAGTPAMKKEKGLNRFFSYNQENSSLDLIAFEWKRDIDFIYYWVISYRVKGWFSIPVNSVVVEFFSNHCS